MGNSAWGRLFNSTKKALASGREERPLVRQAHQSSGQPLNGEGEGLGLAARGFVRQGPGVCNSKKVLHGQWGARGASCARELLGQRAIDFEEVVYEPREH